jgi:hypothetical protein
MEENRSTKYRNKDLSILKHLLDRQAELIKEVEYFRISQASDLDISQNIHPVMRRGFIQMVGDIFELTKELNNEIKKKIGLNIALIRQFRNIATHNYGEITDELAFSLIMHCVNETIMQNVKDEIERINAGINAADNKSADTGDNTTEINKKTE